MNYGYLLQSIQSPSIKFQLISRKLLQILSFIIIYLFPIEKNISFNIFLITIFINLFSFIYFIIKRLQFSIHWPVSFLYSVLWKMRKLASFFFIIISKLFRNYPIISISSFSYWNRSPITDIFSEIEIKLFLFLKHTLWINFQNSNKIKTCRINKNEMQGNDLNHMHFHID